MYTSLPGVIDLFFNLFIQLLIQSCVHSTIHSNIPSFIFLLHVYLLNIYMCGTILDAKDT